MLLEILAHHARWSREKIAIISREGHSSSYAEVYAALVGLSACLKTEFAQALTANPVAIAFSDPRLHFFMALALEFLGVTTLSFIAPPDADIGEAIRQCPVLLSDQLVPGHTGTQVTIRGSWIEQAMRTEPPGRPMPARWHPQQIVTVIATSGSSGSAKCVRLSFAARDAREANRAWRYGFSPASRYLVCLPTSVSTVAVACRATLRNAGTVVFCEPVLDERLFAAITHTTLMPAHLRSYLDGLPKGYVNGAKLRIISIGAPLLTPLRERAARMLNADIDNNYGSNEGGSYARIDDDGIGHIVPGTRIRICDEDNNDVAPGIVGMLWAQSDEVAEGYTDNLLTANSFIGGWFKTGDLAVSVGTRMFKLLGRADHIINLGGMKVSPEAVEVVLLQLGIGRDLAVTSLSQSDGIESIYVCLEQPLVSDAEMISRMETVLGPNVGRVRIIFVDKIPRGATKKILRSKVREIAASHQPAEG